MKNNKVNERLKLLPVCKIPNMMAISDHSYGNDLVAFDADLEKYVPTVDCILTAGDILQQLERHVTVIWQFDQDHRMVATRYKDSVRVYEAVDGTLESVRSDVALAVQHLFISITEKQK